MNRADLENLVARIALRDRRAFETLYSATSAKLFGICLRILNNRHDAEEALQETYIKIWRSADSFVAGEASPVSWFAMIARNAAIDRHRRRRPQETELEEAGEVGDDLPTPEAAAILSSDIGQLDTCLGELDPKHSNAVRQIYLSGWTYNEAAERLEVPPNTLKTWVRRSLIRLRECLNRI